MGRTDRTWLCIHKARAAKPIPDTTLIYLQQLTGPFSIYALCFALNNQIHYLLLYLLANPRSL
jgi:hypothetical protein